MTGSEEQQSAGTALRGGCRLDALRESAMATSATADQQIEEQAKRLGYYACMDPHHRHAVRKAAAKCCDEYQAYVERLYPGQDHEDADPFDISNELDH